MKNDDAIPPKNYLPPSLTLKQGCTIGYLKPSLWGPANREPLASMATMLRCPSLREYGFNAFSRLKSNWDIDEFPFMIAEHIPIGVPIPFLIILHYSLR